MSLSTCSLYTVWGDILFLVFSPIILWEVTVAKSQICKYLPIYYNNVLFCLTANMRSVSEEPVPLHEEFIYCCGAATHVLKCGPWKDLSKDESKNLPRLLFMIIPGKCLFVHFNFGNGIIGAGTLNFSVRNVPR